MLAERVVEPETLDQSVPFNMVLMRSDARDRTNLLLPVLRKRDECPPERCDALDESFREWFEYLLELRERM